MGIRGGAENGAKCNILPSQEVLGNHWSVASTTIIEINHDFKHFSSICVSSVFKLGMSLKIYKLSKCTISFISGKSR